MNIAALPSKFHNLDRLKTAVSVPPCLCLGQRELAILFYNFGATSIAAGRILDRIQLTSGAFLADDLAEVRTVIEGLAPADDAESRLADLLRLCFAQDDLAGAFAVRSANTIEDNSARSFAGLYDTFLDIRGHADMLEAIRAVWLSAYSRAVITERIHAGMLDDSNPMNVIIQRMVPAANAGVAFSRHPVTGDDMILVEIVNGRGDQLVSGQEPGRCYTKDRSRPQIRPEPVNTGDAIILEAILAMLMRVERHLGPVDIEWAWDGQTAWLLQARPITSIDRMELSSDPVLVSADLYGRDGDVLEQMRPLPDFISYFRDKRLRIAEFARRHRLGTATALVLKLNRRGIDLPAFATGIIDAFGSDEVILDFSTSFRQIVLPRARLADELRMLMSDPQRLHTIVVRDFIRGDAGLITHAADLRDACPAVVGEWSTDGLLAINRGTAATRVFRLTATADEDDGLPPATARQIYDATLAAHREIGPVQIEWVMYGTNVYPLDFSVLSDRSMFAGSEDATVISRGYAFAPTLVLEDDRDLEILSIAPSVSLTDIPDASEMGPALASLLARIGSYPAAPIVVTRRPLAALAPLLPLVSGFVFERAAVLSHLSILIREKGIPAAQAPEIYAYAREKAALLIDIGDAVVISAPDEDTANSAPVAGTPSETDGEKHVLAR
ncbi:MAG: PEP/pyruvate-binding domain-containing protein [Agrobacterium vaccinii]